MVEAWAQVVVVAPEARLQEAQVQQVAEQEQPYARQVEGCCWQVVHWVAAQREAGH